MGDTKRDGTRQTQKRKKYVTYETTEKDLRYRASREEKIGKLQFTKTIDGFISNRALAQYVVVIVRPDIFAPVQLIAPGKEPPSKEDMKKLGKVTQYLKDTAELGLEFVELDKTRARLVLVTDASFGNAKELKSHIGFLIMMVDESGACNILHYGSSKCQRVARGVVADELFALVHGFDFAFVMSQLVEDITGLALTLEAIIDSNSVFDVLAKDSATAEKRLQIDIFALRESYSKGELDKIDGNRRTSTQPTP